MTRFYVDGIEVEVSDPTFYLPLEKVDQYLTTLSEYKNDNQSNPLA